MLTLTIKKKWFDMILSGEKKEEYREIKPYYDKRFETVFGCMWIFRGIKNGDMEPPIKEILFRNGYSKNSSQFVAKCALHTGTGKEEWGAEPGKEYYILRIHEITEGGMSGTETVTDYEFFAKLGLCGVCGRNKAAPNRKFCLDCLEKRRIYSNRKYREKSITPEEKKEQAEERKKRYREKKENGICVSCSKKATHGIYCYEHSISKKRFSKKQNEKSKLERHERGLVREERKRKGLCYFCGEKVIDGKNICSRHWKISSDAGKKGREAVKKIGI